MGLRPQPVWNRATKQLLLTLCPCPGRSKWITLTKSPSSKEGLSYAWLFVIITGMLITLHFMPMLHGSVSTYNRSQSSDFSAPYWVFFIMFTHYTISENKSRAHFNFNCCHLLPDLPFQIKRNIDVRHWSFPFLSGNCGKLCHGHIDQWQRIYADIIFNHYWFVNEWDHQFNK